MIAIQSESPRLSELITSYDEIPPQMIVSMAADLFFTSPKTEAVALTEFGEPVGLVTRSKLFTSLSRRFGFELYSKKPIMKIAETAPLIISEDERLEDALQKALQRPAGDIYDELVIVNKTGCFRGLLSVKQMVIQQSHILANSIVQKELAHERAIELEKINSIKSQFITHVTHELRSPINAMIGMAELMKISCEKGYLNQVEDRLALLMSNAVNLRAIITNILDLSKIEAGKMEVIYERFDIVKTLREVAETARMLISGKPVEVEVISHEGPVIIESDPVKVRQIVMNLVSNAAKFTENGSIRLSAGIEDNHLTIAVSDTGIGIKSEDTGKLFIAFSQLEDAMTKRHEGTGLGLTITKNLLDLLGGTIKLSSSFGSGSTFTVSLPTSKQVTTA